jgi:hypothetical protein
MVGDLCGVMPQLPRRPFRDHERQKSEIATVTGVQLGGGRGSPADTTCPECSSGVPPLTAISARR